MPLIESNGHVDVKNLSYYPYRRIQKTIRFLKTFTAPPLHILDLGVDNMLAEAMRKEGYLVENTGGEDLDDNYTSAATSDAELFTSFEIFEHMVAPYNFLKSVPIGKKLICTVPLKVWFRNAHWHPSDPWDRHYHEFEPRQFDMLLNKAGWNIIHSEKWKFPAGRVNGIRPLLRFFYPSYYAVFAEKIK